MLQKDISDFTTIFFSPWEHKISVAFPTCWNQNNAAQLSVKRNIGCSKKKKKQHSALEISSAVGSPLPIKMKNFNFILAQLFNLIDKINAGHVRNTVLNLSRMHVGGLIEYARSFSH